MLRGCGLCRLIRRSRRSLEFCRTHTFFGLNKVAFDGIISGRAIFCSVAKGEDWPILIVPHLDGRQPGGADGKSSRSMESVD